MFTLRLQQYRTADSIGSVIEEHLISIIGPEGKIHENHISRRSAQRRLDALNRAAFLFDRTWA